MYIVYYYNKFIITLGSNDSRMLFTSLYRSTRFTESVRFLVTAKFLTLYDGKRRRGVKTDYYRLS